MSTLSKHIKPIPSIRFDSAFGNANPNEPHLSLVNCRIYSDTYDLVFDFAPSHSKIANRFLQLSLHIFNKLKTFYWRKLIQSDRSNHYVLLIRPLLRSIRNLQNSLVLITPPSFPVATSLINFSNEQFFYEYPLALETNFNTFLNNLHSRLEELSVIKDEFLRDFIDDIAVALDTAYCMVLSFTYFSFYIHNRLQIPRNEFRISDLSKDRLEQLTIKILNRPIYII